MPTGYTSYIEDGIKFEDWIWKCARAFGALIMMRDDSLDTQVPEKFEPSDYHIKEIEKCESKLAEIKLLTEEECIQRAKECYEEEINNIKKHINDKKDLQIKYLDMLEQVKCWQPPTPEHEGLKDFMINQIEESIGFDCDTSYWKDQKPMLLSGAEWKTKRISSLYKDLAYHNEENLKEIERVDGRNLWIKQLRESLVK